jgi:hypothetical protein
VTSERLYRELCLESFRVANKSVWEIDATLTRPGFSGNAVIQRRWTAQADAENSWNATLRANYKLRNPLCDAGHPYPGLASARETQMAGTKPGHDEKRNHFQVVGERLKKLAVEHCRNDESH